MNHKGKNYEEMTVEELRREFRAAFLETDIQCLGNGDYALTPIVAETGEKA